MELSYKSYLRSENYVSIPDFYGGKSVFITEGNTFTGRLIIEKLLRSCPDVENVFVIVKPENGDNLQEIIDRTILNAPIFDPIRATRPNDLKKIVPIKGDLMLRYFGMTLEDLELLKDKVSVIIHSSFTYQKNEKLKAAVEKNLLPVKELMKMCHFMKKLDALVYLSPAASYWHQQIVHEMTYPPPYDPNTIISMTQTLSDEFLDKLEPMLFGEIKPLAVPNTHAFTKALSENVVIKDGAGIPRSIVRPTTLISCLNEPSRGYIDSWTASSKFIPIISRGLKRSMYGDNKVNMDLIPADFVTNITLAAAWNTSLNKYPFVPVFNISSVPENARKYPFDDTVWYPSMTLIKNRQIDQICFGLTHYLPAFILDRLNRLRGREAKMVETLTEIRKQYRDLDWIVRYPQNFQSKNPDKLMKMMSQSDRELFPFDVRTINWPECIESYVYGVRKYLCKQDESREALIQGRKRMFKLKLLDRLVKVSTILVAVGAVTCSVRYFREKEGNVDISNAKK